MLLLKLESLLQTDKLYSTKRNLLKHLQKRSHGAESEVAKAVWNVSAKWKKCHQTPGQSSDKGKH